MVFVFLLGTMINIDQPNHEIWWFSALGRMEQEKQKEAPAGVFFRTNSKEELLIFHVNQDR